MDKSPAFSRGSQLQGNGGDVSRATEADKMTEWCLTAAEGTQARAENMFKAAHQAEVAAMGGHPNAAKSALMDVRKHARAIVMLCTLERDPWGK